MAQLAQIVYPDKIPVLEGRLFDIEKIMDQLVPGWARPVAQAQGPGEGQQAGGGEEQEQSDGNTQGDGEGQQAIGGGGGKQGKMDPAVEEAVQLGINMIQEYTSRDGAPAFTCAAQYKGSGGSNNTLIMERLGMYRVPQDGSSFEVQPRT